MNWKKVTIAGDAILELIAHYDTFGVLGAEQVSDVEVQLYVNAEVYDPQKTAFQKLLKQECLSLTSEEKGENQNWTLQCAELLEPRMLGNLRIVPLHEPQPPKESNENDLFVYVGMGFGTGHHATTQMMIEEVQQLSYSPETVLDVGAGSGILSLAVARCFGSKVCAVESDPDACANAAINLSLNSLEQCIELHQEYYTPTKKKYSLVLANVYTKILCEHEQDFFDQVLPGCSLLLSGIQRVEREKIQEAFSPSRWMLENERELDGWMFFQFRRKE